MKHQFLASMKKNLSPFFMNLLLGSYEYEEKLATKNAPPLAPKRYENQSDPQEHHVDYI